MTNTVLVPALLLYRGSILSHNWSESQKDDTDLSDVTKFAAQLFRLNKVYTYT